MLGAWSMASQATRAVPDTTPALTAQASFEALMQAITGCQSTFTSKIDSLQLEVSLMRKDYDKIRGQLDEVERRAGATEDTVRDHSATLHTVQVRLKHLESRAEEPKTVTGATIFGLLACQGEWRDRTPWPTLSTSSVRSSRRWPSRLTL